MQRIRDFIISFTKNHPLVLFYSVLALIGFFYFYHIILFSPPQSIHRWRQADCLSITLNYYQHGMNFFQPETHHLISDGLTTGYSAGEAPVLYFFIALLYKIFGPHEYIYRICNTLIFFIGLGALFKMAHFFLKDFTTAAFIPLLIFVSPVAVYYANNFLTDSTALALVFMGWQKFIRYTQTRRYMFFVWAVALLSFAGLLKITMSLHLIALACLALADRLGWIRDREKPMFPAPVKAVLPFVAGLAVIMSWTLYAIWYNRLHSSKMFLNSILPWWHINQPDRYEITQMIIGDNFGIYYSDGVLYTLLMAVIVLIICFRYVPRFLNILTVLLVLGGIAFVNLFYLQFVYHDYYILVLLGPLVFILLSSLLALKSGFPKVFSSWIFKSALIVLLIFNVIYARKEMQMRYFGTKRETPLYESFFTIRPYLKTIGVKPDDHVISIPENTNAYTLYLMNQPGYNLRNTDSNTTDTICRMIALGADYLVVNDTTYLNKPEIIPFTKNLAGRYDDILIFRLTSCPKENSLMKKQSPGL